METTERKSIARSVIVKYWRDKAITSSGEVIPDDGKYHEDQIPVVEYITEPRCFACGKWVHGIGEDDAYKLVEQGHPVETLWNGSGSERQGLERCHVLPRQAGGSDTDPSNMFLLCHKCHEESPDTSMPRLFYKWAHKKRKEHAYIVPQANHNLLKMVRDVIDLCEECGKDPMSVDFDKMAEAYPHGWGISDSSIVYAYVEGCASKNSEKQKDPVE